MQGMIFAAGIGSRLKPWTDNHPKALVPIGEKPVISHCLDKFIKTGISKIVVNVHHFASQIVDYLSDNYPDAPITISDETDNLLDTGGGLLKAIPLFSQDEPVIIHNADIITTFELDQIIQAHNESGADVTLLTQHRKTARYFVFENGRLCGWTNIESKQCRPATLKLNDNMDLRAFGGLHIVSPKAMKAISEYATTGDRFSITDFYINKCHDLKINSFDLPENAVWFDVGKPETLEKARKYINSIKS